MRTRTLIPILIALLPAALTISAAEPVERLDEAVASTLALLYPADAAAPPAGDATIRQSLESYFTFPLIARRSLGRGWAQLNPSQREEVEELLTLLMVRSYTSRFADAARPSVSFGDTRLLADDRAQVESTVRLEGGTYDVSYRVIRESPADPWMVYDIVIEGVSLVSNYRKQFSSILQRGSGSDLLKKLREAVAALD